MVGELRASQFTMPSTLTSRTTLSSEPRWARTVARIARPVCLRGGLAVGGVDVGPDLAEVQRPVRPERPVPRDIKQVALPDGRHVGGHGLRGGGQLQFQLGQAALRLPSASVLRFGGSFGRIRRR